MTNKTTKKMVKLPLNKAKSAVAVAIVGMAKIPSEMNQIKRFFTDKRFAGHPISRLLRRLFEFKRMRELAGLQIAVVIIAANLFIYQPALGFDQDAELTHLSPELISVTTESAVRLPLDGYKINQGFNPLHHAIDFGGSLGDPVYPIMKGKVELVDHECFSYGNHVIIDHGNGIKSLYAHMSKTVVTEGQEVDKNTVLGTVGSTGFSTGPHLHLEVIDHGQNINPLSILKAPNSI